MPSANRDAATCLECGGAPASPRIIEVDADRMTRPGGETCSSSFHDQSAASVPRCELPAGCPGLNPDGTCPNGYGVTCESLELEPPKAHAERRASDAANRPEPIKHAPRWNRQTPAQIIADSDAA